MPLAIRSFLGSFCFLSGLGSQCFFSSSYFYAEKLTQTPTQPGDPLWFLRRQLGWVALGVITGFFAYHAPLRLIRRLAFPLSIVSFFLVCLTYFPGIGKNLMGARRWVFFFGYSFQPSELVKLALVLYLSHLLSKREEDDGISVNDPINSLLPLLIVIALMVAPVYLQNDFSTAFFILFVAFTYLFLARVRLFYFIMLSLISLPLAVILLFTKEHRVRRIIAFIDPSSDPAGAGYQVIASHDALMRGGLWGVGLGGSVKKLGGLPEAHSDFIFAVLGEEAGYLGVLFILGLFIAFAFRGFRLAKACDDRFGYYLSVGLTISIVYQAFLNIAVVGGMVPATGITLPFFSAGGSSILISLVMCALLLNISKNNLVRREARYG